VYRSYPFVVEVAMSYGPLDAPHVEVDEHGHLRRTGAPSPGDRRLESRDTFPTSGKRSKICFPSTTPRATDSSQRHAISSKNEERYLEPARTHDRLPAARRRARSLAGKSGADAGARYSYSRPDFDATTRFMVYRLEWTPGSLIWSVDAEDGAGFRMLRTVTGAGNVPDVAMYVVINAAIGGTGGGTPDPSTFPQTFEVDWIRISQ
jgi:hypothetical protein